MTPADAVLLTRSILDENGVTSGFWDDTNDLYKYLNAGRNEAINVNIEMLRKMRVKDPLYTRDILKPLIKLDTTNTTTVGAGLQEYNLPADYIETDWAEYDSAGTTARKLCTMLSFGEIQFKMANSWDAATTAQPYGYIKAVKLGFYPQPTGGGANAFNHWYFYQPADVAAGGAFVLGPEYHLAIVKYAVALGLVKDGKHQEAAGYFKQFYEEII